MTGTRIGLRSRTAPTRPAGGSQVRGERTRAAIIDETVRCVVEEGFEAASAKHIAERAGVTWGVIQYHFGDRNGLLAAVVDAGFEHLREQMADIGLPDGTTRDRVTALVNGAWEAFSTPTSRASLEIVVATRARRDPDLERHLATMGRDLARLGKQVVGDRRGGAAIGGLCWAALRGLALAQMSVSEPIDSTRERAALIDVLTVYLDDVD